MYFAAHRSECGQQPSDCAALFHDAQNRRLKPAVTNKNVLHPTTIARASNKAINLFNPLNLWTIIKQNHKWGFDANLYLNNMLVIAIP